MPDEIKMDWVERSRLRAAAHQAKRNYPGPVGEFLAQEILSWESFGFRFGGNALMGRLTEALLADPVGGAEAAA